MADGVCNVTELAEMCGVRERTVYKWLQYNRIPKPIAGVWTAEQAHQILDDWMKRASTRRPGKAKRKREIFD